MTAIKYPLNPTSEMILAGSHVLLKDLMDQNIDIPIDLVNQARDDAEMVWKAMWKVSTKHYNDAHKITW